jgi:hypothetical protein
LFIGLVCAAASSYASRRAYGGAAGGAGGGADAAAGPDDVGGMVGPWARCAFQVAATPLGAVGCGFGATEAAFPSEDRPGLPTGSPAWSALARSAARGAPVLLSANALP